METLTANLRDVLLTAGSGGDALKALYDLKKAASAKFSLTHLCKAAGITSKGYLSDVMNGRRKLNPRYGEKIGRAFGFDGAWLEALELLFAIDDQADAAEAKRLTQRLAALKKALKSSAEMLPQKLRGMFFAFEVFCAFGLFRNRPSRKELKGYFGPGCGVELEYALHILTSMELAKVEKDDDGEERYVPLTEVVRFSDSEDGISLQTWLEMSVQDAREQVRHWFARRDESFFDANVISVKRQDYLKKLKKIRDAVRELQTDLEVGDADMLIRFNVQVYPTRKGPQK